MQRLVSIFSLSVTRTWYLAIIARVVIYFAGFKSAQAAWITTLRERTSRDTAPADRPKARIVGFFTYFCLQQNIAGICI